ncbi:MAG TPA: YncE family protein [Pyrinomonadaceae bacterium]|nr:YncE family protein [Pyrinomonadaceae bacterium]
MKCSLAVVVLLASAAWMRADQSQAALATATQVTPAASAASTSARSSALLVLNKTENTLAIIDPASLKVLARMPTGEGPHEVVASADGRMAYVANYGTQQKVGSSISIIDIGARRELKRVAVGEVPVGIVIAPDGRRAFVATMQANRVVEINLDDLTLARTVETGVGPDGMAWAGQPS